MPDSVAGTFDIFASASIDPDFFTGANERGKGNRVACFLFGWLAGAGCILTFYHLFSLNYFKDDFLW